MQEIKHYQVIKECDFGICKLNTQISILVIDIKKHAEEVRRLIVENPQTEFWLAMEEMSKDVIFLANSLGIKNIISYPINEVEVNTYIQNNVAEMVVQSPIKKLEPLPCTRVMVVDDNIMNIQLLEEVLKGLNIELDLFTKPQIAIKEILSNSYDLFLLDVLMPEVSGFDLANVIKDSKLNRDTPIIFMSALADYEFKMTGYNSGACHYIEKPYDVELVRYQIYNILEQEIRKKQINKSKDKMLAMITHDLKTPISAEITALQLLLKNKLGDLSSPQQEILEDILSSAKFLKTMTDNILCTYKHSDNGVDLRQEIYDFNSLVEASIKETKYLLGDKNIKLVFDSQVANALVNIDLIEMKRVLNNLIGNAVDYSPCNSNIVICLKSVGDEYHCSVMDNGSGVPLENPNDIFECNNTLAKEQKRIGFGLGLFISKNIVIAHGGKIFVDSKINRGTTITFTLPKIKSF